MKMHSPRLKDPMIGAAEPITILGPLIEESMRLAGIRADRGEILGRFMSGHPRIAVVHGSEDHPAAIGSREQVRRLVRQLWTAGALPVEVSQAVPSEELARGRPGAHYAFLSRNLCAASLATLLEAHAYDAAFVLGACDKMLVGSLRALVESDLARQRRRSRPLYAAFIPAQVGSEVHIEEEGRRRFERLRDQIPEPERERIFSLLEVPIDARVYEHIKVCLDRVFQKRAILEADKDDLEYALAFRSFLPGAGCASSAASIVTRLMIAAFGLVPRGLDLSMEPPSDEQLAHAVGRIVQGIERRERKISVSFLVRANLQNSVSAWSATGGYPSWLLHLHYLAQALGVRLSPNILGRRMARVPCLLAFDSQDHRSPHGIAAESDAGGNSGVDTLMRTLSEKRLIDDRAPTLEGPWMHRIMEARSANGHYFCSTITPISPNCGVYRVHGNMGTSALVRVSAPHEVERYDKKVYLADYYLGYEQLLAVIGKPGGVLDRVRKKVTQDDLLRTWALNWVGSPEGIPEDAARWNKKRLWEHLVANGLLRVMLCVAGEGPRASGMRQLGYPVSVDSEVLQQTCILATDGRVVFGHPGATITQIVPEALEGAGLAAVRAGDWIYLNLRKGELQVVTATRNSAGHRILRESELRGRRELRMRVQELERRRASLLPSVRSLLDRVSSAAEGVSPA